MFGGPPPPPSAEEKARASAAANRTLNSFIIGAVTLYVAPWLLAPAFERFYK
ncbi:hypothetical protein BDZ90DRAFT_260671 [Jaminaea rosea]|uniref:Uncharacterized protein n=1 Tax=Jaminaea rosea TaxID=1569628 RepID=A0A316URP8_9BASI|nr:hypothetical protein BDZ90DRAFT_260671 [Jaminaea rosea]PWN26991.1 hypothetical protein BDZ90DRAFT_260671 [Jaminaea rosea]